MATVASLLTAEEYGSLPDNDQPSELVRGRIVPLNVPYPLHGKVCGQVVYLLKTYVDKHDLGHVVCNDGGVVTERDPDTVRGPDVSYYSYQRVPKGPLPKRYLPAAPEIAFEVRSPDDSWKKILTKVAEYLNAGVVVVGVLDPDPQTVNVYYADLQGQLLHADDDFALPQVLDDFRVLVRRFFE